MSEMFRKILPYTLDVSVLQEQCPNERYFAASPFNNPVEIKPKPDTPLDPDKVAAAQSVTETVMDAYEKDRAIRSLKVIWTAEDLEAAAFNNVPDNPQSSRARMRIAAKYLNDANLEVQQDGLRHDKNGEIVSLDLMISAPHTYSACHAEFLIAAVENLKRNGVNINARVCTFEKSPDTELTEEARTAYLDCVNQNTDIQLYHSASETDQSFIFSMRRIMDIDTTSIIEIMKSDKFEPMNPADQAAGIALAFGKRAIETGRLIPVSRYRPPSLLNDGKR